MRLGESEEGTRVVGVSRPPLDAGEKVRGKAVYLPDMEVPGMAHARVLRSPFAHARLLSLDASGARALPGVVCVLTRDELLADPDIEPYYGYVFRDAPLVALDKVRHQGDIVAVVVAEDVGIAEEALELIEVEYEELPAVMDVTEAMAEGAPLVHEEMRPIAPELQPVAGTNICHDLTFRRGHVEQGFQESDYIFEDEYSVPPVQHCALELHGCIASYEESQITVWTNCQSPFPLRLELERIFKRPARIIVPYVGGGFGSKSRDRLEAVVVAASKLAGRPVRLILSQEETFQTFIRPALKCWLKTGVKRDGTLVARQYRFVMDVGAYSISGARTANNTIKVATGPYRIPHVHVECYAVYTNKPPSSPYRGLPTTQHTMAYETQMDRIAEALGMDPVELRMKNLLTEGDVHVTGDLHRSVGAKECLELVATAMGPRQPRGLRDAKAPLRGKGLSCTIKYTITPAMPTVSARAEVVLGDDGLFELRVGSVNMGQGSDTAFAIIAAEALGVPVDAFSVHLRDTDVVPLDHGTTASRATYHTGSAVLEASVGLRAQIFETAAELLEEESTRLEATDSGVRVSGEEGRQVSFGELARRRGGAISATGECLVGGTYTDPSGRQYPIASTFWTFASAGAEVEVSPDTGEVRVIRAAAAANVGKAINPEAVKAQLEGGLAMDLGPTLFEQLVWGEGGQLMNASLMDYPLPSMETVPEYHTEFVEHPVPGGPYGAKGMGEVGAVIIPAAILNAVYDATGILFHDLPLTPERVLRGLEEAAAQGQETKDVV